MSQPHNQHNAQGPKMRIQLNTNVTLRSAAAASLASVDASHDASIAGLENTTTDHESRIAALEP